MTASLSNVKEEIILEAIVCYQNIKTGSGGDTYVGGKKTKHFKFCPNKLTEFVKKKIIDSLGINIRLKIRVRSSIHIVLGRVAKG